MTPNTRSLILVESARFKLAATARLAEGGRASQFEACALFLAASRAERRALSATVNPTRHDRLRSAVEVCGCLIDGLYPSAVLEWAWGNVLEASEGLPESQVRSTRSRIDPQFSAFLRGYRQTIKRTPDTAAAMASGRSPENEKELLLLVDAYPGDPRLWDLLAMVYRSRDAVQPAWTAIQRARNLDPEDTTFRGAEIDLVVEAQPDKAIALLEDAFRDVMAGADADICFGFIAAAIRLGLRRDGRLWLERAADAATRAMSQPPLHPRDYAWFRAFLLTSRELLAGRKPGVDILYRTGLGDWVITSPRKDPIEILLQRGTQLRAA